ncbi:MAG: helix-turn-helix domain-containing protein [Bryobacteraceae bacterium]
MVTQSEEGFGPHMREVDAARYLGVSIAMLRKQRRFGKPPVYKKFGDAVVYRRRDLDDFLAACPTFPKSETAPRPAEGAQ